MTDQIDRVALRAQRHATITYLLDSLDAKDALIADLAGAVEGLLETCVGSGWSDDEYLENLIDQHCKHPDLVKPYADRVLIGRATLSKAREAMK